MRLLKAHRGRVVHVYLDGLTFEGVLDDVSVDSVSLRSAKVLEGNRTAQLPGTAVVATASIVWAAVLP